MKKEVQLPSIPQDVTPEQKQFYDGILTVLRDLRTEIATIPDWTAVTYINSWVDYSATLRSEYYKDQFGYIHLRVGCKSGSTANPFVMPEGYRTGEYCQFPIHSTPSGTTVIPYIQIYPDGIVTFGNYTNTFCTHGEIIYKAEN